MNIPESLVSLLTAAYPYAAELQSLGMALQGAMAVRAGANKDRSMHWFHAFALTTVLAFGGGWLGFMLMGKPTSMVSGGDVNVTACIIAFVAVNYTPFDMGYKILNLLPLKVLITVLAQLFRSTGLMKFIDTAHSEISPTPYYPIPVLGPIVYGTMLGNMGGLMVKGFDGYLKDGIPWPFQNGIFIGTFYHLFAHDESGILGTTLRTAFKTLGDGVLPLGLDSITFARVATAAFMQISGILMLPEFFGPSFNPIVDPPIWIGRSISSSSMTTKSVTEGKAPGSAKADDSSSSSASTSAPPEAKKRRQRRKKKTA